jgi:hypothetical protein
VLEVAGDGAVETAAGEEGGLAQQSRSGSANEEWHGDWQAPREPVVVLVRVGDDEPAGRRFALAQSGDWREWNLVSGRMIERTAEIEHDGRALGFELYAAAADLMGATVDADSHG